VNLERFDFDRHFTEPNIIGVDEAGRGCLAGPLVAGAVLFHQPSLSEEKQALLAGLIDSKKISKSKRERLFPLILRHADAWSVIFKSARLIDEKGIQWANESALGEAATKIETEESLVLVDGRKLRLHPLKHRAIIGGDNKSAAIAAASIIAKVSRDRLMESLDQYYTGYQFAKHAGYGTLAHREAIAALGPSPIHRRSFRGAS
jgi:ribonuclease HII